MIDGYKLNFLPLISLKSHISAHWNITSKSLSRWQLQRFNTMRPEGLSRAQRDSWNGAGRTANAHLRVLEAWPPQHTSNSFQGLSAHSHEASKPVPCAQVWLTFKQRTCFKGNESAFYALLNNKPPPPPLHSKKQICRLRCVFKRCHFICTSYRRVTFSLSLSKNCTCITWV